MTQHPTTTTHNHNKITAGTTEQIGQIRYEQLRAHDYAGTREELQNPNEWPATHWILTNRNGPP